MGPPEVFYHVGCCTQRWRNIFRQQSRTFIEAGLRPRCCVLGNYWQVQRVRRRWPVIYSSPNLAEYEIPTLRQLWLWCRENRDGTVIYCHTKGSSKPNAHHAVWRKTMMDWVVSRWRENLKLLEDHDLAGVNWGPHYGHRNKWWHFPGNFWMARAEWVASLQDPLEYQQHPDHDWERYTARRRTRWASRRLSAWPRMCAEIWISSRGTPRVANLMCQGAAFGQPAGLYRAVAAIPAVHIVSPFSRPANLPALIDNLAPANVEWTLLTGPPYPSLPLPTWARTVEVPPWPEGIAPYVWKIRWFLEHEPIIDDDWYAFLPDDSGYDENAIEAVRQSAGDVAIVSTKRGNRIPPGTPPEKRYGTSTLVAAPENMRVGHVDLMQLFMRGRALKTIDYPNHRNGDGMIAAGLPGRWAIHYLPEVFGRFNWLEPGRWDKK